MTEIFKPSFSLPSIVHPQKVVDVGWFMKSANYVYGSAGWKLDGDGTIEAFEVTIKGTLSGNADTASSSGSCTGNAATATALAVARTIGGVSFNGESNINLPGVNTGGNQDTSGTAANATVLENIRTINGVNFNGSANITVTAAAGTLSGSTLASGVTTSSLTSVGTLTSATITGDLIVDTSTLKVDSSNNRVGIGETAPASDLVVRADSAGGRGGEISIVNYAATTVGNEAALNFGLGNSTYAGDAGNVQIKAYQVNVNGAADTVFSNWNGGAFVNTVQFKAGGAVYQYTSGTQLFLSANSPTSLPATGAAANMFFYSANGAVYWNSSSVRHKTDIEDVEDAYADAVLDLRPVWFRSTCRDDNKEWGHWGLIAEEVDLVDQRLVSYGPIPRVDDDGDEITDADGKTLNELDADGENVLRPENVQYDRIIPLLINLIKRQDARLEALEDA